MDPRPGTYILVLFFDREYTIRVGALGRRSFQSGYYLYVGSAMGPGGIAARVGRHLSTGKKCRWHIDYLTESVPIVSVWYRIGTERYEHVWASCLAAVDGVGLVPGFGASDCRCNTHLFHFADRPVPNILSARCAPP